MKNFPHANDDRGTEVDVRTVGNIGVALRLMGIDTSKETGRVYAQINELVASDWMEAMIPLWKGPEGASTLFYSGKAESEILPKLEALRDKMKLLIQTQ